MDNEEVFNEAAQLPIPGIPIKPAYDKRKKHQPATVGAFPALIRGNQQLHVRVLQYPGTDATLDIREWLRTESFDGYSKKGISITLKQLLVLEEYLPTIKAVLKSLETPNT